VQPRYVGISPLAFCMRVRTRTGYYAISFILGSSAKGIACSLGQERRFAEESLINGRTNEGGDFSSHVSCVLSGLTEVVSLPWAKEGKPYGRGVFFSVADLGRCSNWIWIVYVVNSSVSIGVIILLVSILFCP